MTKFEALFRRPGPMIGMVHLGPLPGAPAYGGRLEPVATRALREAGTLAEEGFDGILVENFGDSPFLPGSVGPETVASMAAITQRIVDAMEVPVGVNVLRNDARAALAVAVATGARFIRVNVHTGACATDQGVLEGRAWETLRERSRLRADVLVFADVLVKHGSPLGPVDPHHAARDAVERGRADALLVTGPATGAAPGARMLNEVKEAVPATPVLVASGLTPENASFLMQIADGAVVGSSLKRGGRADGAVDRRRARRLLRAARA
jgi:membrane complex biogenesis BtpA family protein